MNDDRSPEPPLQKFYFKLAHKRIILLAGLSTAVLFLVITSSSKKYLPENAPAIISLQFCASPESFLAVLRQWGKAGVTGYRESLWIDYLFPAAYAIFFASLISWLEKKKTISTGRIPIIFFFPLGAGLLDWLENSIHLQLLVNPSTVNAVEVFSAFLISSAKWLLLVVTMLFIFTRFLRLFIRET